MTNQIWILYILSVAGLVWIGCSSNSTEPNGNNNSGSRANTISMRIDGANWTNATVGGSFYSDSAGIYTLGILGTNGDQKVTLAIVSPVAMRTGRYTNSSGFLGTFSDSSTSVLALSDLAVGTSQVFLNNFD